MSRTTLLLLLLAVLVGLTMLATAWLGFDAEHAVKSYGGNDVKECRTVSFKIGLRECRLSLVWCRNLTYYGNPKEAELAATKWPPGPHWYLRAYRLPPWSGTSPAQGGIGLLGIRYEWAENVGPRRGTRYLSYTTNSFDFEQLVVPAWFLILLPASPFLLWQFRHWSRLRARRAGLCPVCGYDLRAAPERCPECGTGFSSCAEHKG